MDFDEFVQILATELKYQDPDDPVSGTEYVSQLAQISSLSALSEISTSVTNASAFSLIGQEVTYSATDTSGSTVTGSGTVLSVTVSGSNTYVNVDGTTVDYSSITKVGSDSTTTSST
ncbi:Flagellar basal-body rod modification protein FlgD [Sporomusa ovata]|uniref:Flagellar basal-body rod modification protein FlgD n=1 Tax=Sporomusa ovata TaxID=2378 RepID=A0A0U1KXI4_9FIRM|nr:Flagellar basal-body rod modification protein FlgD [Sporomusa ovata]